MNKIQSSLFSVGAIGILLGIILYFNQYENAPYLLICCAIIMALSQLTSFKKTENKTLNRLYAQQMIASIILIFSGGSMFMLSGNEWMVGIAIAAFIYLYTSLRISKEEEKN
ncbi:MAG: hypothetical protein GX905_01020 [Bacteroidales bacterium]|nr:hypothetical protein [Bacteroidales bacterium]